MGAAARAGSVADGRHDRRGLGHAGGAAQPSRVLALAAAVAVLLVGVFGTGGSPLGVMLAFGDGLYSAVLFSSRRASWTVSALAGVVTGGIALLSLVDDGGRAAVTALLNIGLLLAVPVFWALEVRRQAELAATEPAPNRPPAWPIWTGAAAVAAERAAWPATCTT